MKKGQYSIDIKWIDPNGNGIISTFMYQGITEGEVEKKAQVGFKTYIEKTWGYYDSEDMEIKSINVKKVKMGLFSERSWKVR